MVNKETINLNPSKNKALSVAYNEEIKKKVGNVYRKRRSLIGKTIGALASELGIGVTTISELEKGYNFPKIETVIYIGLCLGFEFNEIIALMAVPDNNKSSKKKEFSISDIAKSIGERHSNSQETITFKEQMENYRKQVESIKNMPTLNKAGEDIVLEFINFISSQSKYQAGSAYSKRKNKKEH